MEFENKVTKEPSGKEFFFQNSLAEVEKPAIYSLEVEFAKTKKNRDLKPYLIVCVFIFLLIVAAVGTGRYLDYKSKQIDINISDFEDIQLKETLNSVLEKEKELDRKTAELEKLRSSVRKEQKKNRR